MKPQSLSKSHNKGERLEPLSILPVFIDLHGKRAIVIGSAGPAIWKAELLAKAGAKVELISTSTSRELLEFVSNIKPPACLTLTIADWRNCDLSHAEMIVGDVGESEAEELFKQAKKHTSLVNIIDKTAYCTFQFGSIVNKSPLVIGISTTGAAPVLAQHVRSLFEATLPADIQSLAKRAARIRARVNEKLGASANRRKYWSAFFGKAFGFSVAAQRKFSKPYLIKVSSVEDLTLRDLRALQTADEIHFDAGVNQQILQFGRREALRIVLRAGCEIAAPSNAELNLVFVRNAPDI